MVETDKELLTPREVAARLRVTKRTLANMAHKGIGPKPLRFGGCVRYRVVDVDAFIAGEGVPCTQKS